MEISKTYIYYTFILLMTADQVEMFLFQHLEKILKANTSG